MTTASAVVRAIDDSRAAVHHLVRAAAVVPVLLSLGFLVFGHGDERAFTVPVVVHAVLVVLSLEVSRLLTLPVRFDGLTLFTAWEAARGCVAPVIIQYVGNGSAFQIGRAHV